MSFALQRLLKIQMYNTALYVQTSGILIKRYMVAFAKFRCPELDVNAILANDYRKLV